MIARSQTVQALHADDAGFTLLELMIAMTLLGLLSVLLFGSLRFGTTVWERSEGAATDDNRIRTVQDEVGALLEQAYPFFDSSDAAHPHVWFEGAADSVRFMAPDEALPGALDYATLRIESVDGDAALVLTTTRELDPDRVEHRKVLLPRAASLSLAYSRGEPDKNDIHWYDQWRGQPSLPALIRVKVVLQNHNKRAWPDLIVAPRVAVDTGCVYDPLVKFCRGR